MLKKKKVKWHRKVKRKCTFLSQGSPREAYNLNKVFCYNLASNYLLYPHSATKIHTDPWTMQGLGEPNPCAVENPCVNSDAPKT